MMHALTRRSLLAAFAGCLLLLASPVARGEAPAAGTEPPAAATDPLPSWNDGPTKTSIVDFVTAVTQAGRRRLRGPKGSHRHLRQ